MIPIIIAASLVAKCNALRLVKDNDDYLQPVPPEGISTAKLDTSIEEALRNSMRLGRVLASAAKNESVSEASAALLRSLRPCATCKRHSRYGERNDGGYVMCDDDMDRGGLKAAYSYGIHGSDLWGNAISEKYKIPVFEYDCYDPKRPAKCPTCDLRFHNECITNNTAPPHPKFRTLSQHLQRNGHSAAEESSMLLKIDVEGTEWSVFETESAENLRKFREIVGEFHFLEDVKRHEGFLKAVTTILDAGFVVDHIHGNNYVGEFSIGNQMIPRCLEITFIQRPDHSDESNCVDHSVNLPEDAPNMKERPDFPPVALLPKL